MMHANPDWIKDGEKFALIGLDVQIDENLRGKELDDRMSFLTSLNFVLPEEWRGWLGSLRAEAIEQSSLYLLAKSASETPNVLDAENRMLERSVSDWFAGLMLTTRFWQDADAFLVTGSRTDDHVAVRGFRGLRPPQRAIVDVEGPITASQLSIAASIGATFSSFDGRWRPEHWRLLRCISIYQQARHDSDLLNRIHQFVRCLEGLIAATKGNTTRQFKYRTELFVGPSHHKIMGELYEVRSDLEHLHENRYLADFDRHSRIRLVKIEAIAEWIARSCLSRILQKPSLMEHFGNVESIKQFWGMPPRDQRQIWGDCIDPCAPVRAFNFAHVSDEELGARP
jgi:hypothetical protein